MSPQFEIKLHFQTRAEKAIHCPCIFALHRPTPAGPKAAGQSERKKASKCKSSPSKRPRCAFLIGWQASAKPTLAGGEAAVTSCGVPFRKTPPNPQRHGSETATTTSTPRSRNLWPVAWARQFQRRPAAVRSCRNSVGMPCHRHSRPAAWALWALQRTGAPGPQAACAAEPEPNLHRETSAVANTKNVGENERPKLEEEKSHSKFSSLSSSLLKSSLLSFLFFSFGNPFFLQLKRATVS